MDARVSIVYLVSVSVLVVVVVVGLVVLHHAFDCTDEVV